MISTPIIEVAIGLIFLYSLLGLLVTQINSVISNALKLRAKTLKSGLQKLLIDERLQAEILVHPMIKVVVPDQQQNSLQVSAQTAQEVNKPTAEVNNVTYIAPSVFSEALISTLFTRVYSPVENEIKKIPDVMIQGNLMTLLNNLQTIPTPSELAELEAAAAQLPAQFSTGLVAALKPVRTVLEETRYQSNNLQTLQAGVSTIETPAIRDALRILLSTTNNIDQARVKLERWFDDGMERASASYIRWIQIFSLVFSLLLAIIFNIDTIYLARTLWDDPLLRAQVVIAAKRLDTPATTTTDGTGAVPRDEIPADGTATPVPEGMPLDERSLQDQVAEQVQRLNEPLVEIQGDIADIGLLVQQLLELQLPIGWEYTPVTTEMVALSQEVGLPSPYSNTRNVWNLLRPDLSLILQKVIGILATTIAAAQGAPFWFDLLNRVTRRNVNTTTVTATTSTTLPPG
jgi:hypothetical protein